MNTSQQSFPNPGIKPRRQMANLELAICSRCQHLRPTIPKPFIRANGKSPVRKTVTRFKKDPRLLIRRPETKLTIQKRRFCLECIADQSEVRLPDFEGLGSTSSTRVTSAALCLERDLRETDPELKFQDRFLPGTFRGALIHQDFASHTNRGSQNIGAQRNRTREIVGREVQDKTKVPDLVRSKSSELSDEVFAYKRAAISRGILKTKAEWLISNVELSYVGAEVHFSLPLSTLIRHYLGSEGLRQFSQTKADALVVGSIDLLLYYLRFPGLTGPAVVVGDYKTFWPDDPAEQQRIRQEYGHSLQLRLYALVIAWIIEETKLQNVTRRPYFVTPGGPSEYVDYRWSSHNDAIRDAWKVLGAVWEHVQRRNQIEMRLPYTSMVGEKLLPYFPPRVPDPDICSACPANGICTATYGHPLSRKLLTGLVDPDEIEEIHF